MLSIALLVNIVMVGAGLSLAAPANGGYPQPPKRHAFSIPKTNGFPSPNSDQLRTIETKADGLVNITNISPPPKLSPQEIAQYQLLAFNEFFKTAFFSSLLYNVTNNVTGYEYDKKDELAAILSDILAQEEIHALAAIKHLKDNNAFVPSPCKYEFGSTTLQHAINFAQVFTTIMMGTLQDTAVTFAKNGNSASIRSLAAVMENEAEQNGYFRHILAKKPSAHPFPTTSIPSFLFSALNMFTVPDSCPFPLSKINITLFRPFNLVGVGIIKQNDQTLSFNTDLGGVSAAAKYVGKTNDTQLYITYVTVQLKPISVRATNLRWNETRLMVDAHFPYSQYLMTGLSLASLTTKADFVSVEEMPAYTLAAPAVIQADQCLNANNSLDELE
ncbi:hypothetical protein PT974_05126 [Cladobotryum mycophilum]|uniref:Late sexual development protein n=1 Tax=Cladobotryum mycophilum TaxID=491253 RepID=A0ABR0SR89_9HYPO